MLLADAAKMNWDTEPAELAQDNGQWYADTLALLHRKPDCIGFHLCDAYQRNRVRGYGLLDEAEKPDQANVALIMAANEKIGRWMDEQL